MKGPDFETVYKDNRQKVWNLISKYVYNQHDREDLLQEIFMKAFRSLKKFRGDSDISTWVYRIAVNTAINHVNGISRRNALFNMLKIDRFFNKEEVENTLPTEEDISLWEPLKVLNPRQKMILLLAEVEEKPLDEISSLLKIPTGTVKSNLSRAKDILRQEIQGKERLNGKIQ